MTGQREGGEEGGVEGWMWINVAGGADESSFTASRIDP